MQTCKKLKCFIQHISPLQVVIYISVIFLSTNNAMLSKIQTKKIVNPFNKVKLGEGGRDLFSLVEVG